MSIASEITRLQTLKTNIRSAIVYKGIEAASAHDMEDFEADILSISGENAAGYIGVIYPAGSICTCTNGAISLEAENTSGYAIFKLPALGIWNIEATDGTFGKQESVTISADIKNAIVIIEYRLPIDYQEVEYIESTGTQVITSDVYAASNLIVRAKLMYLHNGGDMLFGNSQSGSAFRLFGVGNTFYFDIYNESGSNRLIGGSISPTKIYEITIGNHYIVDTNTETDISRGTKGTSFQSNTEKMKIMSDGNDYGRIYYFRIYSVKTLIGDFVPCYRKSDGEIGVYDIVSNTFYGNTGSGTLIKGADVNN